MLHFVFLAVIFILLISICSNVRNPGNNCALLTLKCISGNLNSDRSVGSVVSVRCERHLLEEGTTAPLATTTCTTNMTYTHTDIQLPCKSELVTCCVTCYVTCVLCDVLRDVLCDELRDVLCDELYDVLCDVCVTCYVTCCVTSCLTCCVTCV